MILSITTSFSQLAVNSPFSRFGVGNLANQNNAILSGMRGVESSYSSRNYINTSNPALLTRLKSTTFEVGAGYNWLQTSENGNQNSTSNYDFDYLNAAFPFHRNYTLGIGLRPYSKSTYDTETTTILDSENNIKDIYKGEGGITSVNWTNSVAIIKDSVNSQLFSAGVDVALLVGNITQSNTSILVTNGIENTSYSSVLNNNIYRGAKLNFGLGYRKEFFVGDDFRTLNNKKCNLDSNKIITIQSPKLFYPERAADRAKKSIQTKYTIIYPGNNNIKISKTIKDGEQREFLLDNYAAIIRKGFGVLILPSALGKTYNELKADYLETYNLIKDIEPEYTTYENADAYSQEYLRYKSGIFFNVGLSYEHSNNLNVSGTEEITRFRTSTLEPLENTYSLSEFDDVVLKLPNVYKLGISFDKPNPTGKDACGNNKKSTWLAGIDFALSNWSSSSYYGSDLSSTNTYKISLGGEITPNRGIANSISATKVSRFFNQLIYRGGLYYETLPFTINSESISEVGINFGLTIPSNNNGGLLTWNVSLASRGNSLNETYIKTGLGITLNESRWFHRTKVGL